MIAALAGLVGWGAFHARAWVLPGAQAHGASIPYAESGEVLLHGVNPGGSLYPSFHMPLSSLLAARLFSRASPGPWREAAILAGLLGTAALCVLSGSASAAVAAVLVLLAWPELWPRHHTYVEFFYALFVLQAALALAWRAASPTPARTFALAAAIGASLLFRSPLLLLPPLLAALEWFRPGERGRTRAVNALILLTAPYLPLLPWAAMNWVLHHQLSVFERGESLPNIVSASGGLVHYSEEFWRARVASEPALQSQHLPRVLGWAFGEIARHPLRYAEGFAGRLAYALSLRPWLFALAAAGAWTNRREPAVRALALLCAYLLLIHCAIAVLPDYMVPLWPLLAALAAMLFLPPAAAELSPRLASAARGWLLLLLAASCLAAAEADGRAVRYAWLASRRPPDSDVALAEALARAPDDAWLLYRRGWRRLQGGDRAGTAADWTRAAALRPGNALWSLHRDWARMLAGDSQPLLAWTGPLSPLTREAEKADPELMKAYALRREGRPAQAREKLLAAFSIIAGGHPGRPAHSLEMLWDRAGELFGALPPDEWIPLWRDLDLLFDDPASRKVARLHDPMREAVLRLQAAGSTREAHDLARRLLRARPDSAPLWTDKALLDAAAGSWEAAAAALRKAIEADETFLAAPLSLGAVYVRLGRRGEALKVYDRALALDGAAEDPLRARLAAARDELRRGK